MQNRNGSNSSPAKEHDLEHLDIAYSYNDDIHLHEIRCMTRGFMFRDEQFTNPMYIRALQKKHGQVFPSILHSLPYGMETPDDALEVADALSLFYPDNRCLTFFAEWCRKTAPDCCMYTVSW